MGGCVFSSHPEAQYRYPYSERCPLLDYSSQQLKLMAETFNGSQHAERIGSDICLVFPDVLIPAHLSVLASKSEIFKILAESLSDTKKIPYIKVDGVRSTIFETILEFIYTGGTYIDKRMVAELSMAAEYLKMEDMIQACIVYVRKMDTEQALLILLPKDIPKSNRLFQMAISYVIKNYSRVYEHRHFVELPAPILFYLLCNDRLDVTSELQVLESLLKWTFYGGKRRQEIFDELIRCIKFGNMNQDELSYVSTMARRVMHPGKCQDLLLEACSNARQPRVAESEISESYEFTDETEDAESITGSRGYLEEDEEDEEDEERGETSDDNNKNSDVEYLKRKRTNQLTDDDKISEDELKNFDQREFKSDEKIKRDRVTADISVPNGQDEKRKFSHSDMTEKLVKTPECGKRGLILDENVQDSDQIEYLPEESTENIKDSESFLEKDLSELDVGSIGKDKSETLNKITFDTTIPDTADEKRKISHSDMTEKLVETPECGKRGLILDENVQDSDQIEYLPEESTENIKDSESFLEKDLSELDVDSIGKDENETRNKITFDTTIPDTADEKRKFSHSDMTENLVETPECGKRGLILDENVQDSVQIEYLPEESTENIKDSDSFLEKYLLEFDVDSIGKDESETRNKITSDTTIPDTADEKRKFSHSDMTEKLVETPECGKRGLILDENVQDSVKIEYLPEVSTKNIKDSDSFLEKYLLELDVDSIGKDESETRNKITSDTTIPDTADEKRKFSHSDMTEKLVETPECGKRGLILDENVQDSVQIEYLPEESTENIKDSDSFLEKYLLELDVDSIGKDESETRNKITSDRTIPDTADEKRKFSHSNMTEKLVETPECGKRELILDENVQDSVQIEYLPEESTENIKDSDSFLEKYLLEFDVDSIGKDESETRNKITSDTTIPDTADEKRKFSHSDMTEKLVETPECGKRGLILDENVQDSVQIEYLPEESTENIKDSDSFLEKYLLELDVDSIGKDESETRNKITFDTTIPDTADEKRKLSHSDMTEKLVETPECGKRGLILDENVQDSVKIEYLPEESTENIKDSDSFLEKYLLEFDVDSIGKDESETRNKITFDTTIPDTADEKRKFSHSDMTEKLVETPECGKRGLILDENVQDSVQIEYLPEESTENIKDSDSFLEKYLLELDVDSIGKDESETRNKITSDTTIPDTADEKRKFSHSDMTEKLVETPECGKRGLILDENVQDSVQIEYLPEESTENIKDSDSFLEKYLLELDVDSIGKDERETRNKITSDTTIPDTADEKRKFSHSDMTEKLVETPECGKRGLILDENVQDSVQIEYLPEESTENIKDSDSFLEKYLLESDVDSIGKDESETRNKITFDTTIPDTADEKRKFSHSDMTEQLVETPECGKRGLILDENVQDSVQIEYLPEESTENIKDSDSFLEKYLLELDVDSIGKDESETRNKITSDTTIPDTADEKRKFSHSDMTEKLVETPECGKRGLILDENVQDSDQIEYLPEESTENIKDSDSFLEKYLSELDVDSIGKDESETRNKITFDTTIPDTADEKRKFSHSDMTEQLVETPECGKRGLILDENVQDSVKIEYLPEESTENIKDSDSFLEKYLLEFDVDSIGKDESETRNKITFDTTIQDTADEKRKFSHSDMTEKLVETPECGKRGLILDENVQDSVKIEYLPEESTENIKDSDSFLEKYLLEFDVDSIGKDESETRNKITSDTTIPDTADEKRKFSHSDMTEKLVETPECGKRGLILDENVQDSVQIEYLPEESTENIKDSDSFLEKYLLELDVDSIGKDESETRNKITSDTTIPDTADEKRKFSHSDMTEKLVETPECGKRGLILDENVQDSVQIEYLPEESTENIKDSDSFLEKDLLELDVDSIGKDESETRNKITFDTTIPDTADEKRKFCHSDMTEKLVETPECGKRGLILDENVQDSVQIEYLPEESTENIKDSDSFLEKYLLESDVDSIGKDESETRNKITFDTTIPDTADEKRKFSHSDMTEQLVETPECGKRGLILDENVQDSVQIEYLPEESTENIKDSDSFLEKYLLEFDVDSIGKDESETRNKITFDTTIQDTADEKRKFSHSDMTEKLVETPECGKRGLILDENVQDSVKIEYLPEESTENIKDSDSFLEKYLLEFDVDSIGKDESETRNKITSDTTIPDTADEKRKFSHSDMTEKLVETPECGKRGLILDENVQDSVQIEYLPEESTENIKDSDSFLEKYLLELDVDSIGKDESETRNKITSDTTIPDTADEKRKFSHSDMTEKLVETPECGKRGLILDENVQDSVQIEYLPEESTENIKDSDSFLEKDLLELDVDSIGKDESETRNKITFDTTIPDTADEKRKFCHSDMTEKLVETPECGKRGLILDENVQDSVQIEYLPEESTENIKDSDSFLEKYLLELDVDSIGKDESGTRNKITSDTTIPDTADEKRKFFHSDMTEKLVETPECGKRGLILDENVQDSVKIEYLPEETTENIKDSDSFLEKYLLEFDVDSIGKDESETRNKITFDTTIPDTADEKRKFSHSDMTEKLVETPECGKRGLILYENVQDSVKIEYLPEENTENIKDSDSFLEKYLLELDVDSIGKDESETRNKITFDTTIPDTADEKRKFSHSDMTENLVETPEYGKRGLILDENVQDSVQIEYLPEESTENIKDSDSFLEKYLLEFDVDSIGKDESETRNKITSDTTIPDTADEKRKFSHSDMTEKLVETPECGKRGLILDENVQDSVQIEYLLEESTENIKDSDSFLEKYLLELDVDSIGKDESETRNKITSDTTIPDTADEKRKFSHSDMTEKLVETPECGKRGLILDENVQDSVQIEYLPEESTENIKDSDSFLEKYLLELDVDSIGKDESETRNKIASDTTIPDTADEKRKFSHSDMTEKLVETPECGKRGLILDENVQDSVQIEYLPEESTENIKDSDSFLEKYLLEFDVDSIGKDESETRNKITFDTTIPDTADEKRKFSHSDMTEKLVETPECGKRGLILDENVQDSVKIEYLPEESTENIKDSDSFLEKYLLELDVDSIGKDESETRNKITSDTTIPDTADEKRKFSHSDMTEKLVETPECGKRGLILDENVQDSVQIEYLPEESTENIKDSDSFLEKYLLELDVDSIGKDESETRNKITFDTTIPDTADEKRKFCHSDMTEKLVETPECGKRGLILDENVQDSVQIEYLPEESTENIKDSDSFLEKYLLESDVDSIGKDESETRNKITFDTTIPDTADEKRKFSHSDMTEQLVETPECGKRGLILDENVQDSVKIEYLPEESTENIKDSDSFLEKYLLEFDVDSIGKDESETRNKITFDTTIQDTADEKRKFSHSDMTEKLVETPECGKRGLILDENVQDSVKIEYLPEESTENIKDSESFLEEYLLELDVDSTGKDESETRNKITFDTTIPDTADEKRKISHSEMTEKLVETPECGKRGLILDENVQDSVKIEYLPEESTENIKDSDSFLEKYLLELDVDSIGKDESETRNKITFDTTIPDTADEKRKFSHSDMTEKLAETPECGKRGLILDENVQDSVQIEYLPEESTENIKDSDSFLEKYLLKSDVDSIGKDESETRNKITFDTTIPDTADEKRKFSHSDMTEQLVETPECGKRGLILDENVQDSVKIEYLPEESTENIKDSDSFLEKYLLELDVDSIGKDESETRNKITFDTTIQDTADEKRKLSHSDMTEKLVETPECGKRGLILDEHVQDSVQIEYLPEESTENIKDSDSFLEKYLLEFDVDSIGKDESETRNKITFDRTIPDTADEKRKFSHSDMTEKLVETPECGKRGLILYENVQDSVKIEYLPEENTENIKDSDSFLEKYLLELDVDSIGKDESETRNKITFDTTIPDTADEKRKFSHSDMTEKLVETPECGKRGLILDENVQDSVQIEYLPEESTENIKDSESFLENDLSELDVDSIGKDEDETRNKITFDTTIPDTADEKRKLGHSEITFQLMEKSVYDEHAGTLSESVLGKSSENMEESDNISEENLLDINQCSFVFADKNNQDSIHNEYLTEEITDQVTDFCNSLVDDPRNFYQITFENDERENHEAVTIDTAVQDSPYRTREFSYVGEVSKLPENTKFEECIETLNESIRSSVKNEYLMQESTDNIKDYECFAEENHLQLDIDSIGKDGHLDFDQNSIRKDENENRNKVTFDSNIPDTLYGNRQFSHSEMTTKKLVETPEWEERKAAFNESVQDSVQIEYLPKGSTDNIKDSENPPSDVESGSIGKDDPLENSSRKAESENQDILTVAATISETAYQMENLNKSTHSSLKNATSSYPIKQVAKCPVIVVNELNTPSGSQQLTENQDSEIGCSSKLESLKTDSNFQESAKDAPEDFQSPEGIDGGNREHVQLVDSFEERTSENVEMGERRTLDITDPVSLPEYYNNLSRDSAEKIGVNDRRFADSRHRTVIFPTVSFKFESNNGTSYLELTAELECDERGESSDANDQDYFPMEDRTDEIREHNNISKVQSTQSHNPIGESFCQHEDSKASEKDCVLHESTSSAPEDFQLRKETDEESRESDPITASDEEMTPENVEITDTLNQLENDAKASKDAKEQIDVKNSVFADSQHRTVIFPTVAFQFDDLPNVSHGHHIEWNTDTFEVP